MPRPKTRSTCKTCGSEAYYAKGLCKKHYLNEKRGLPPEYERVSYKDGRPCAHCDKPAYSLGLCKTHYARRRKHGDPNVYLKNNPMGSGRMTNAAGYTSLYLPDHPNANKAGWVQEHRAVMTEALGRALLPGENVHHKNGVRGDNRLENLELWATLGSQPSGQRVPDLIRYANEIIARYGTDPAAVP